MQPPPENEATTIDPLADLMIGVAALFLVAAVVVAPPIARSLNAGGATPDRGTWQLDGQVVRPFTAMRDGLLLPDQRFIPLSDLLAAPRLPASIREASALLLVVEAGGEDAAFFLEAIAAQQGRSEIAIVRRIAAR
jgi:hypothetical protein